jgi:hypothetical protein
MKIIPDESYDEMAAAFQCSQIQLLDKVLERNGINLELRKKINEEYANSFGVFLDQYWFDSEVGKVYPIILFSKNHWESNSGDYISNSGCFSYSEYSMGNIYWYYEENVDVDEPQKFGRIKH